MAFLTTSQMITHIYANVSNAISQGNNTLLQNAIDAAIVEAKGYCSRYRIEQLFDNVDADPAWVADPILLTHVKNITKWHFVGIANANIDMEDAQARYDLAIRWLTSVQNGKVVPPGWPPSTPADTSTFFHMTSKRKRNNYFN